MVSLKDRFIIASATVAFGFYNTCCLTPPIDLTPNIPNEIIYEHRPEQCGYEPRTTKQVAENYFMLMFDTDCNGSIDSYAVAKRIGGKWDAKTNKTEYFYRNPIIYWTDSNNNGKVEENEKIYDRAQDGLNGNEETSEQVKQKYKSLEERTKT